MISVARWGTGAKLCRLGRSCTVGSWRYWTWTVLSSSSAINYGIGKIEDARRQITGSPYIDNRISWTQTFLMWSAASSCLLTKKTLEVKRNNIYEEFLIKILSGVTRHNIYELLLKRQTTCPFSRFVNLALRTSQTIRHSFGLYQIPSSPLLTVCTGARPARHSLLWYHDRVFLRTLPPTPHDGFYKTLWKFRWFSLRKAVILINDGFIFIFWILHLHWWFWSSCYSSPAM